MLLLQTSWAYTLLLNRPFSNALEALWLVLALWLYARWQQVRPTPGRVVRIHARHLRTLTVCWLRQRVARYLPLPTASLPPCPHPSCS